MMSGRSILGRIPPTAWWLGLAAYFGGMLALAVAAPVLFHTTRAQHISMPGIASPPLDMGNETGGEIFGNILNAFAYVEVVALLLLLVGLLGKLRAGTRVSHVLAVLYAVLALTVLVDLGYVRPKVWNTRETVRELAATAPGGAAGAAFSPPAKQSFDALHALSERLGQVKFWLLLAMLILSVPAPAGAMLTKPAQP
ncbi:MAG TPA: hypothetical protein VH253_10160 [Phycisphaerae bacterium]|nr:hypothetical protein [Phycisphaerae bacterium]